MKSCILFEQAVERIPVYGVSQIFYAGLQLLEAKLKI